MNSNLPKFTSQLPAFDLVTVTRALLKHIKFIVIFGFLSGGLAVFYALSLPNIYHSEAMVLPINAGGSLNPGSMPHLQALSKVGLGGGFQSLLGSNDDQKLEILFNSKTLAKRVLSLVPEVYENLFSGSWDAQKKEWKSKTDHPHPQIVLESFRNRINVEASLLDKTINISAEFTDPVLAQKVIKVYLSEVKKLLNKNAFTLDERKLTFIKEQLQENKIKYLLEGKALRNFFNNNRVSNSDGMVDININEPYSNSVLDDKSSSSVIVKSIPNDVYIEFLSAKQQIVNSMILGLEQQYLMTKISSQEEKMGFFVVDEPDIPFKKIGPKRTMIVVIGGLLGGVLSVMLVLLYEFFQSHAELKSLFVLKRRKKAA